MKKNVFYLTMAVIGTVIFITTFYGAQAVGLKSPWTWIAAILAVPLTRPLYKRALAKEVIKTVK